MPETRGLGKGLRALIPEKPTQQQSPTPQPTKQEPIESSQTQTTASVREGIVEVNVEAIRPSPYQPRKTFDETKIGELAESIQGGGLIYPLLVRETGESGESGPIYELIAGERRLRALKKIGKEKAAVIIKEVTDDRALETALIENLQREDLNPIEEAQAYHKLFTTFAFSLKEIGKKVGKQETSVNNMMRLLKLSKPVRKEVEAGRIPMGHARALLAVTSEKLQLEIAQRSIKEGWTTRKMEQVTQDYATGKRVAKKQRLPDPNLIAAEKKLEKSLGTRVQILHGKRRGWIRLAYFSLKDFDRIVKKLSSGS